MTAREGRPVLSGVVALALVSLMVGAVAGVGAFLGSRALGLAGGGEESVQRTPEVSMVIPGPGSARSPGTAANADRKPSVEASPTKAEVRPRAPIQLVATPRSVSSFERVYLTGSYPRGEGAILQVERRQAGAWRGFPVTVSVSGGGFRTYVQTSQPGKNLFRVRDSDTGALSNVVTVTVG